jgi:predicted RNase H-like nuclease
VLSLERSIPLRIEQVLRVEYKHSNHSVFNESSSPLEHTMTAPVVGIDGCRAGWVVASRHGATVVTSLNFEQTSLAGIDMPIGLPASTPRACDTEARRFLGRRSSTVFSAPARSCLGATAHSDASERNRIALGQGLSIQSFHLLPKIAEIDALIDPADEHRIVEIHPECAFARMNHDTPLAPKRTVKGVDQRRALLRTAGFDLPGVPRGAAVDDLLDAYAVLWSAERFDRGEHVTFTDGTRDARGLLMRIVS